jgi:6,7-dimethyl-8-ribityllumazine synthase
MPQQISGMLDGAGLRVGIVLARFNDFIGSRLLDGCVDVLTRHGTSADDVVVVRVPGAFEIPLVARALGERKGIDVVICLGAVIRGSTPHFDYVAAESAKGIAALSTQLGKPVIYGVLTTDTIEQAIERAGTKAGNKGADAALAAIEMVSVLRAIRAMPE